MMKMTGGTLLGMFCIILHVQVSSATLTPCKEVDFVYNCSHHLLQDIPKNLSPTIKYLILSHNQILKISADSFDGLPNLITIDVSYNDISKVAPGAFSKLPKLDTLNLKKTQLSKPEPGIFQGLTKLRFLDFSQIHPRLIKIPDNLFEDLISLEKLKLDGNSLTSLNLGDNCALPTTKVLSLVNNTFTNLSNTDFLCFKNANLTRLLLSGNKLEYIEREAFSHFDSIQVLDVSGELLHGGISPGSIQNLAMALDGVKLQSLRLTHLRLVTLTDLMFKGLHNLTTLDLSNNLIKTFENACFNSLANLTRLALYNNNITRVENQTFSALTSLQFLDMERNNVSVIFSGFFVSLSKSNMSYINLKLNGVKRIEPGAFKSLTNLTQLELAENHINQELTGDEFDGLNELQILNIGANTNINLKSTAFSKVLNLKILILNKVQLRSIRLKPSPFQVLKNVEILDLSNNNMNYVYADVFSGMTKLQKLYLNHNNLYLMLKTDDPVFFLNNLSSLLQLDLSSNGVSSIHSNTFVGLTRLMSLKLSHNKLMKLPNNLFKPTVGIEHLDLSNNKFNIFNQSMFDKIPHLKTMAAGGTNPFACTCDLEWFRNWINTSHVSIVDINDCICDSPPSYRDKPVLSFHPSDLNCDHIIPFYIWIISGSVLLMLVVVSFVCYRKRYRVKRYYCVLKARRKGYEPIDSENNPYTYNAFVSYCDANEEWVTLMRKNVENEETGIKLCIHKRDFIAGQYITTNINESMKASYRTVCVISRAYLEREWCRHELDVALSPSYNKDRQVTILILIEEIPPDLLTEDVKVHRQINKFIKEKTYLKYPENEEEIPLFWEKLKDSIQIGKTGS